MLIGVILLTACSRQKQTPASETEKPRLRITAAIFPIWDWTQNILGENPGDAELTLLVRNGVDLHSYQPSVDDILTVSAADLFIYVGGESDQWVTDALKQSVNPGQHTLSLTAVLGNEAKTEETVEGMQTDGDIADTETPDEHVWLSLRLAIRFSEAICKELCLLDPDNAAVYRANTAAYTEKLRTLDNVYTQSIDDADLKTLLFGDRFPFRYLTEDYGLTYYAAFSGCSAETEASFETVTFLAQKCDELNLPAVLTIDGTDHRIAQTIIRNSADTSRKILTLDSMQSVSSKEISAGKTYLSVMASNLEILKQALNREDN